MENSCGRCEAFLEFGFVTYWCIEDAGHEKWDIPEPEHHAVIRDNHGTEVKCYWQS